MIFHFFYNLLSPLAILIAKVLANFMPKIASSFEARKSWERRWRSGMHSIKGNYILFHVSSVGELEQIRPVLESWQPKEQQFVISYFSPSILDYAKDWSFVVYADFLPLDTKQNMETFFSIVQPSMIVLDRYDVWPNFLAQAEQQNIPIALINASTPPLGLRGWLGLWLRRSLFRKVHIWTYVDAMAAGAWEPFLGKRAIAFVTGNPRVDRVLSRVKSQALASSESVQKIQDSCAFDKNWTIVAGSSWPVEEGILLNALQIIRRQSVEAQQTRMIFVPHEPSEEHVQLLLQKCASCHFSALRFSDLQKSNTQDSMQKKCDILIVDTLGQLTEIYALGALAYVGGGFERKEIHSLIEPSAHLVPMAFGPRHRRSPEARSLVVMGGAFTHSKEDANAFAYWFYSLLSDAQKRAKAVEALQLFVKMNVGAGERVSHFLVEGFRIVHKMYPFS